jgi:hypothetical protein
MNGNTYIKASVGAGLVCLVLATASLQAQNAYSGGYGSQGGYNGNQNYNSSYFVAPPRVYIAPGWGSAGVSYVSVPTPTMQSQMVARSFFAGGVVALTRVNQAGAAYAYTGGRVVTTPSLNRIMPLGKSRAQLLAGRR